LYLDYNTFRLEDKSYYIKSNQEERIYYINDGIISSLTKEDNRYSYQINENIIQLNIENFTITDYDIKGKEEFEIDLRQVAEMSVILQGAKQLLNI
jgi:hypothetical protein